MDRLTDGQSYYYMARIGQHECHNDVVTRKAKEGVGTMVPIVEEM